jgi:putative transposase
MANRESSTSWKEFLLVPEKTGVARIDPPCERRSSWAETRRIIEVLPEPYWQRCYVRFLRNALDYLPRKVADDCLIELRWLYDRRNAQDARRDPAARLLR